MLYIADMLGYSPIGQQARRWRSRSPAYDDPEARGTVDAGHDPQGTRVYNAADNADDLIVFETQDVKSTLKPGDDDSHRHRASPPRASPS